ncbi:ABC transporter permease [Nitrospirillum sp. BR 11163]|uniref:ABC transporter permease n=1 Tax=Nitrospirillum sp. BR 11163 TaxID=3104323 RepID=UPI002AFFC77D|nr:ABC transporter permease [Nitrospirillum sp. BR 11163]MEA1674640.1 ABC transporter permease [Nitrospirillum sp. BR 11163]
MTADILSKVEGPRAGRLSRLRARHGGLRPLLLGLVLPLGVIATATLVRLIVRGDPWEMAGPPLLWPGEDDQFPLGTDALGRDILTGIAAGAPVSLLIGLVSAALTVGLGMTIGALGGYYGGRVDAVLMRVTELFQTVPQFILAVVLVAIIKPSVATIVIAIGVVSWPPTARLMRAQFLALREREFVQAARTLGMGDWQLIRTQFLPNALPPIIVMSSLTVALAIQTEAALAFMGLGDPNVMTWGGMVGAGQQDLMGAWYVCGLPGLAILVTVLAFNLLGEWLNDALNPRLGER